MDTLGESLGKFFSVAIRGQTYLNALYLLIAFPLGLLYFVFLVTGLALGIPLTIIWVGLLILVAVFAAWYGLVAFERQIAIWMLKEEIPPMVRRDQSQLTIWQKFVAALGNPVTWKGLVYLFAKFPLGTLSFIALVTLVSLSGAFIAAPFYYQYVPQAELVIDGLPWASAWLIDTPFEASIAFLFGILLALVSMHILNGMAWVSGKFARVMLGNFSTPGVTSQSLVAAQSSAAP
jgi:hypothetical protein